MTKLSTASFFNIASVYKKPRPDGRVPDTFGSSPIGSVFVQLSSFEQSIDAAEREVRESESERASSFLHSSFLPSHPHSLPPSQVFLTAAGEVRDLQFAYWRRRSVRRRQEYAFQRRKAAISRSIRVMVAKYTTYDAQGNAVRPIFLIGSAGASFGRLACGARKPPVLELRKLLAREAVVILCDEYRTSCLCLGCARYLRHPPDPKDVSQEQYGVYVCDHEDCHMCGVYVNRDTAAALKIPGRALASSLGLPLGAFARTAAVNEATSTSVISDTLKTFSTYLQPGLGTGRATNLLQPGVLLGRRERREAVPRKHRALLRPKPNPPHPPPLAGPAAAPSPL